MWTFDVFHEHHDHVKHGRIDTHRRRVHVSQDEFPKHHDAVQVACVMVLSIHGGMVTRVLTCI